MTESAAIDGSVNIDALYKSSFMNLPDRTQYAGYDRSGSGGLADRRAEIGAAYQKLAVERKALLSTSGGAGTAGYALVPVSVDSKMVDTSRKQCPFYEIIPKVTNRGLTADYVVLSAKGAASWLPEDAALADANDTKSRSSKPVKYLYIKGRVTGQAQVTIPGFTLAGFQPGSGFNDGFGDSEAANAMQQEVLIKGRAMIEALEDGIFNGDSSADANQFDGLIKLQGTTNKTDLNTAAMTLDHIDTAVKDAIDDGGLPNIATCGTAVYKDLSGLLSAKVGYLAAAKEVFWGFNTIVLNTIAGEIPVIWSRFLTNTSGSKALYFWDLNVIELRVLQDITYKPLAETNDSTPFMLKWYGCVINRAPAFCSYIGEIA